MPFRCRKDYFNAQITFNNNLGIKTYYLGTSIDAKLTFSTQDAQLPLNILIFLGQDLWSSLKELIQLLWCKMVK